MKFFLNISFWKSWVGATVPQPPPQLAPLAAFHASYLPLTSTDFAPACPPTSAPFSAPFRPLNVLYLSKKPKLNYIFEVEWGFDLEYFHLEWAFSIDFAPACSPTSASGTNRAH